MTRRLIPTSAFTRSSRRLRKRRPAIRRALSDSLALLHDDAFHPKLRTHKLAGDLDGQWASSVSHDLRITFRFETYEGVEAIVLLSIGTHDEVY